MKQYPIHSVQRYDALAMHNLDVGATLQLSPNSPYQPTIVESSKNGFKGSSSYAVVQMGQLEDGSPQYVAYTNTSEMEKELRERMLAYYLSKDCVDKQMDAQMISGYDINKLIMCDQQGNRWYIGPEQVQSGMHIQLEQCNICDLGLGANGYSAGILDIPCVKDFMFEDGRLAMHYDYARCINRDGYVTQEFGPSMATNINVSQDYTALLERDQERQQTHSIDLSQWR